jgi:hypothetical protein
VPGRKGFVAKGKEGRLNVIMLQGFEAEGPIIPSGSINEDKGKFESPNRDAVAKSDVDMNNVEVLGGEAIDGFPMGGLQNCSVRSEG